MTNLAWYDLNTEGIIFKLQNKCPKCNCQKLMSFTPNQYMLDGGSIKNKLQKKKFRGAQTTWSKFLKPAINATTPFMGMAVSVKTKNPKVGQATTYILKSISRDNFLSLTDMHSGAVLRLRVMYIISIKVC